MPIYEFTCTACGEHFERLQGFSHDAPSCPACHDPRVRRLISVVAGLTGRPSWDSGSGGCACGGACACGR